MNATIKQSESMRAAVIDIGSSSIKLLIGEKTGDDVKILESIKNVVPLGKETFFKEKISQEIINQTVSLIEKYKQTLKEYEVTDVVIIATNAVREARNQKIFLDTIYRKTGFKIDVLNIGDVVYYIDSYLSQKLKATYPIHEKNLLIAELGAGSLDISIMEKGYAVMNMGFPVGTLRVQQFKNKLAGSAEETLEAIKEWVEHEVLYIDRGLLNIHIDDIILIDERYAAHLPKVLSLKKPETKFYQFKKQDAEELLAKVTEQNADGIVNTYKVPAEFSESVDAYAVILNTLFKLTERDYVYILETSLAEAILAYNLLNIEATKKNNKISQLISVATFLCRKFNLDLTHAKHVAGLCETLFNSLKQSLGLDDNDMIYLILAAYLHDIGMFINNRSHHKHTEYVISALTLFRLSDEEMKIIACVARYHRKSDPMRTHFLFGSLSPDHQVLVQKLSALLKIANSLDQSHKQKVQKLEVKFDRKENVNLMVTTNDNFALEKMNFQEKKDLYEEITGSKILLTVKN